MSFFEEVLVGFGQEVLFGSFKWIGIGFKWIFYLRKKSISEIKTENWNARIGFMFFILLLGLIIYILNLIKP